MSPEQIKLKKLEEARTALTSADILFDYDRASLSETAKTVLANKAEYLVKNPDIQIKIEGHCDERGSNEYNLGLGERRAAAARKYLITFGVSSSMIETITYGEENPVCTEHYESCWRQNRRAKFVVID